MAVPMLDIGVQNAPLKARVMEAIGGLIDSSAFVLGPIVEAFEADLAAYCGAGHAVGMTSGTDTLLASLMALGVGPGDEVVVPAFSFFATASVVARVGATPVFVDIDPVTFNIDPAGIAAAITDNTKAIIPVHLFGQCAEMGEISKTAEGRGVAIIEDTAQAIGAKHNGQHAGTLGTINSISFYPTKNLGAFGDAGAVTTNDAELAQRLRQIRLHGQTDAYRHELLGGNFRIDALQAAVLKIKLANLDEYTAGRRAAAERYNGLLSDLPITLPVEAADQFHVYNQYTIRCDNRDALCENLKAKGIGHKV